MLDEKMLKETFSTLRASEGTLMEVMKVVNNKKRPVRASRVILIAAALALALGISAAAYVGFVKYDNPAAMLEAFFGENDKAEGGGIVEYDDEGRLKTNLPAWERTPVDATLAQELIAPYISAVSEQVSFRGYTLRVEAALFDPLTGGGLVYYVLENPDGVSGYEAALTGEVDWPGDAAIFTQLNYPYRAYIDSAQTTDTSLYVCAYYIHIAEWEKVAPTLKVSIGVGREDGTRKVEKSVDIAFEDGGGMAGATMADGAVRLSPIGIWIDSKALGLRHADDIDSIVLRYGDGSEYVFKDEEGFVDNSAYALIRSATGAVTYLHNRIVDIEAVRSVSINGVLYDNT